MSHILILYASVGSGHKAAAKALVKAFARRQVNQVWCKDSLDYGSSLFRELYVGSYLELSENAPTLWSYFYQRSDKSETDLTKELRTLVDRIGVTELNKLVRRCQPDAIICTHFLPLNLLAREKKKGRLAPPLYCVVTDYTGHVYWVNPYVDNYFVATPQTGDMLAQRGVAESSISVTGIPIEPAIAEAKDLVQIRQAHQISQAPVITLLGSGLNIKRVQQIVTGLLRRDIMGTLIVVAGRNKKLQTALKNMRNSPTLHLQVLGFVDNLDDLIAASELVISKSGGLIVSEVMARHTPMLIIDPIPGQEEWNADYVVGVGAGVQIRLAEMSPFVVQNLIATPSRLKVLRAGAKRAGQAHAALTVADAVLEAVAA